MIVINDPGPKLGFAEPSSPRANIEIEAEATVKQAIWRKMDRFMGTSAKKKSGQGRQSSPMTIYHILLSSKTNSELTLSLGAAIFCWQSW